jgi:hypothetical protein
MQGVKERSFLVGLIGKVVVERIDKGVSDEHQVGLKIGDLFPSVAKQNLFESIHLTFENGDAEFRPVEDVPEGEVGLVTEQYRDAAAKGGKSQCQSNGGFYVEFPALTRRCYRPFGSPTR